MTPETESLIDTLEAALTFARPHLPNRQLPEHLEHRLAAQRRQYVIAKRDRNDGIGAVWCVNRIVRQVVTIGDYAAERYGRIDGPGVSLEGDDVMVAWDIADDGGETPAVSVAISDLTATGWIAS